MAHTGLADLRVVASMHQRKALMAELSDGFIALPGGIGTLEELFEVWTWAQLGSHSKPCALLNVLGFYDRLLGFLDFVVGEAFMRPMHVNDLPGANGHLQQCAPHAQRSQGYGHRHCGARVKQGCRGTPVQHYVSTFAKWVARFQAEGVDGSRDRSSRPLSSPSQIRLTTCSAVERLRRERRTQEHTAAELAISKASVSPILRCLGLSLLSSLEPQDPRPRYERERPGEISSAASTALAIVSPAVAPAIAEPGRRLGICSRRHRRPFPDRTRRHLPQSE